LVVTRSAHVRAFGCVNSASPWQGRSASSPENWLGGGWDKLWPFVQRYEQIWAGDHLRVQVSALGQSASGSIDVAEDYVRLEVFLPWFLAKLVKTIQPLIRKEGMLLLEKKQRALRCHPPMGHQ
jgi:hypothetical protein